MDKCDIDLLILTLLFSANVQPFQVSQIMGQYKGPHAQTFCLKRLYNINKRTEELQILLLDWLLIVMMQRKLLQN